MTNASFYFFCSLHQRNFRILRLKSDTSQNEYQAKRCLLLYDTVRRGLDDMGHFILGRNIYDDCFQHDIQFYDAGTTIRGSCASENMIATSLMVPQMPISKSEDGDADGGVVELKKHNNRSSPPSYSASTIPNDTDEYHAILKNKLYQVCTTVALSHESVVNVEGMSAQVKIQALQSDLMFKVLPIQEHGEPDNGTRVRQAIIGTNDRCGVMGKVPPNEYFFSRVPVANDPSSSIVCACCRRLIPEESVVLLENGALFLFDLVSCVNCQKLNGYVKGSELRVLWDDLYGTKNYKWLGIKFNLHPRILVVAGSYVALLHDFIHDECNVICLGKIEILSFYVVVDEDPFLSFSKAGADRFQCVLASKGLLLLCDVRTPMVPLLCWAHDLDNPCFIDVIRLMSSGKIEAQRYYASWNLVLNFDVAHREPLFNFEDSLPYFWSDDGYEIPKRFKYVNLNYLRLTVCGFGRFRSSLALSFVFNNISLPTSICEAASRQMWATFPLELLDLDDSLVDHILPLPILLALHEFRNGYPNSEKMCGFSLDMEFGFRFNEVMRVTTKMAISDFCLLNNDEFVPLADDRDEIWFNSQRPKQFLFYYPVVGKALHKVIDPNDTMDSVGLELFGDLCPIEFKFDVTVMNFVLTYT
ncbi:hypothetical protein CXB51_027140 [Gossypium anomalum]|uniref:Uncharacterized protein n=1 Tax=Gossypium anomalum TaxID=47600 RepID=A0A8J5Z5K7_9ROSI|nr:hypothetical protein CXB51_027140 [Gossypium anomalum]